MFYYKRERASCQYIAAGFGPIPICYDKPIMSEYPLNNLTPLMRQYFEIKDERPDIILLMRVGDFFEAYGADAEIISRELEITLTGREDKQVGARIPMAGVPHHATERYVARLMGKGFKVALCDQVEDPKLAKGLVKRRVTRVLTPGTLVEDALLDSRRNNYLVAAIRGERLPAGIGVVDISTGEFLSTEIAPEMGIDKIVEEVVRLQPAECLLSSESETELADAIKASVNTVITYHASHDQRRSARQQLLDHFGTQSLRGFGAESYTTGVEAAALLLDYMRQTHQSALTHIKTLGTYSTDSYMSLDSATRRNLELTQSQLDGSRAKSLLHVIDRTVTALGGRMLRKWLDQPLLELASINLRHESLALFANDSLLRGDVRDTLRGMSDLERLTARICSGAANARDLQALKISIETLGQLRKDVIRLPDGSALAPVVERMESAPPELHHLLDRAIDDDPPLLLREGGLIKDGYDQDLDNLRELRSGGRAFIAAIEEQERLRTGIKGLKVGFNNVFGYYIEVSKLNIDSVPPEYIRKQTTSNTERYITSELKEREAQVLGADERILDLEYRLFCEIRDRIGDQYSSILLKIAAAVATIDATAALAEVAVTQHYARPIMREDGRLHLVQSSHPVVAQLHGGFIPNDVDLNIDDSRLHIITGPNAAGKSTYLRQVALCVLLAQIGSFVPAESAQIGIVDRIFTRVGAHDDLASGQSTFMVEMNETANILNNVTANSLVILDEVGRGTSTFDGLALAWSIAEYLHEVHAKTLFATHYHQLNELEKTLPGAKNFRVAVKEQGEHIIWLRKIMPGGTDKSYGIQVARLAGIPDIVLRRASDILKGLESKNKGGSAPVISKSAKLQLTLFEAERHPAVEKLDELDLAVLSPIEALNVLYELQKSVKVK
jgi:DNA mismatch repair protein MutS